MELTEDEKKIIERHREIHKEKLTKPIRNEFEKDHFLPVWRKIEERIKEMDESLMKDIKDFIFNRVQTHIEEKKNLKKIIEENILGLQEDQRKIFKHEQFYRLRVLENQSLENEITNIVCELHKHYKSCSCGNDYY